MNARRHFSLEDGAEVLPFRLLIRFFGHVPLINERHLDVFARVRVLKLPELGEHLINLLRFDRLRLGQERLPFGDLDLLIGQEVGKLPLLVQLRIQVPHIVLASLTKFHKLLALIKHTVIIFGLDPFYACLKIVFMLVNFIIGQVQFRMEKVRLSLEIVEVVKMVDIWSQHRMRYAPAE